MKDDAPMQAFSQGDLVRIGSGDQVFLVVSKNAFIKAADMFHVCPVIRGVKEGPLHIIVNGRDGTNGTAVTEEIRLIDAKAGNCEKLDSIPLQEMIEVSDMLQGVYEYD